MAHDLVANAAGVIPMAFTGPRSAIWHGLGQALSDNMPLDTWIVEAGMNWELQSSPCEYLTTDGSRQVFPDKVVLRRSDTQDAISVVTDKFRIVQPKDVMEFFRDLTEIHGMKLSTAGVLSGGKRFWALADLGKEAEITPGDAIRGQLLLTTSTDGQSSTTAKFVGTRVVCANTLDIAMRGNGKMVRVTHKRDFNAKDVKIDLGLIDKSWDTYIDKIKALSAKKMDDVALGAFVRGLFYDPAKDPAEQGWSIDRQVDRVIALAKAGSGSDMSKGTRWGALCGVTEALTHQAGTRRGLETQFVDAYLGVQAQQKVNAFLELSMMA